MTALTLYRIPRRWLRKFLKPAALWFNARAMASSETEIDLLNAEIELDRELICLEHRRQVKLMQQRRTIGGW